MIDRTSKKWIQKLRRQQVYAANVRARRRGLPATLTTPQWSEILNQHGFRCARCGETGRILSIDHVVPLVAGGGTVASNIAPLCLDCQARKGQKLIDYRKEAA